MSMNLLGAVCRATGHKICFDAFDLCAWICSNIPKLWSAYRRKIMCGLKCGALGNVSRLNQENYLDEKYPGTIKTLSFWSKCSSIPTPSLSPHFSYVFLFSTFLFNPFLFFGIQMSNILYISWPYSVPDICGLTRLSGDCDCLLSAKASNIFSYIGIGLSYVLVPVSVRYHYFPK
jgi:hypothetical protein